MNTFGNHNEDQDEEQNENSKQDTVGANVLTLVSKTDKAVEISWTGYGRNDPDTIYEVYRDDVMIASTKDLCFLNVGLTPETTYTYLIISKDNEGYIRSESNKICATTDVLQSIEDSPQKDQDDNEKEVNNNESNLIAYKIVMMKAWIYWKNQLTQGSLKLTGT